MNIYVKSFLIGLSLADHFLMCIFYTNHSMGTEHFAEDYFFHLGSVHHSQTQTLNSKLRTIMDYKHTNRMNDCKVFYTIKPRIEISWANMEIKARSSF